MTFTDKVVVITGASRGIGRACAILFAEQGAKVVIHYNANRAAAQETLDACAGEGHLIVPADMGNPDGVQFLIDHSIKKLGRIDVLVNNAGVYADHDPNTVDYPTWQDQWQHTLAVNLVGAANAAYLAAKHMADQGGGKIVNVSSRGAFRGEPTAPAYGASKAGMNSMSQSLAKAYAHKNIIVTAVAPGWVETDMAAKYLGTGIAEQSPLNRVAAPEEIARAVLFLASEGCEFATGAILDVNGASYLRT